MGDINPDLVIELTQKLVRLQTEAGQEKPVTDLLLAELPLLGFDEVRADENGSVVAVVQGTQPGRTLLLDAHTDTVGIAPGVPWQHEPFGGEIDGERLFGRGASDMKGALAAMIAAVVAVDRTRLAGRVVVSASVLEEVLEGVALKAVMDATEPDFVVIGEASDLTLVHGGRGRAEIHLETTGRPAHSSAPQQGVNAVHAMIPALQAIDEMPLPADPVVGQAIMVLTDIISEPYPGHSVIPSRCRATYDRRLVPGETQESVLQALARLPTIDGASISTTLATGEYRSHTGTQLRKQKWFPAWRLEQTDPFVQGAARGIQDAGIEVAFSAYQFCTNAAYSSGVAGVPTVGFGPSRESLVHIVDEYVEIAQLLQAARGYLGILHAVLAQPI